MKAEKRNKMKAPKMKALKMKAPKMSKIKIKMRKSQRQEKLPRAGINVKSDNNIKL